MSRIAAAFETMKQQGRKAFVGYAMAGFPGVGDDLKLAQGLLDSGADLLEIGVPFSDPMADGPVIQRCGELALERGGGLARALAMAKDLRAGSDKPLLIMSYCNPPFSMGWDNFFAAAEAAGVDGLILPDLSPEEAAPLLAGAHAHGLDLVLLAAPTSTPARLKKIAQAAGGFVYFVSVAGVTGANKGFDEHLGGVIAAMRKVSPLPLAIGFGVSNPDKARSAAAVADAVVVASAVLNPLLEGKDLDAALAVARDIAQATHGR